MKPKAFSRVVGVLRTHGFVCNASLIGVLSTTGI